MQTSAHRGVLHAQRRGASCTQTSIVCTEDLNVHTGRLSPLSPRSSSYSQRRLLHTKGAECTLMHDCRLCRQADVCTQRRVVCTGESCKAECRLMHTEECCLHRGVRVSIDAASVAEKPVVHTRALTTQRSLMKTYAHRGLLFVQRGSVYVMYRDEARTHTCRICCRGAACTQTSIVDVCAQRSVVCAGEYCIHCHICHRSTCCAHR